MHKRHTETKIYPGKPQGRKPKNLILLKDNISRYNTSKYKHHIDKIYTNPIDKEENSPTIENPQIVFYNPRTIFFSLRELLHLSF